MITMKRFPIQHYIVGYRYKNNLSVLYRFIDKLLLLMRIPDMTTEKMISIYNREIEKSYLKPLYIGDNIVTDDNRYYSDIRYDIELLKFIPIKLLALYVNETVYIYLDISKTSNKNINFNNKVIPIEKSIFDNVVKGGKTIADLKYINQLKDIELTMDDRRISTKDTIYIVDSNIYEMYELGIPIDDVSYPLIDETKSFYIGNLPKALYSSLNAYISNTLLTTSLEVSYLPFLPVDMLTDILEKDINDLKYDINRGLVRQIQNTYNVNDYLPNAREIASNVAINLITAEMTEFDVKRFIEEFPYFTDINELMNQEFRTVLLLLNDSDQYGTISEKLTINDTLTYSGSLEEALLYF